MFIYKKIYLILFNILLCVQTILYKTEFNLNGVFTLNSKSNESLYFSAENGTLLFKTEKNQFDIIQNSMKDYNILSRKLKKYIGIDKSKNDEIILYDKKESENIEFITWNFIYVLNDQYIIQNNYNKKYLKENNNSLVFDKTNLDLIKNKFIDKVYIFRILKLFETNENIKERDLKIVEKEPIDVFIKYIDLSDKTLKRDGIKQIYKDEDNEELRYSLRSIFQYIPWVRKIYIVMPNAKVKFLKPYNEIKEKIIYVNDKDFLGYDTANIFAFTFNLYKMEKFGISKNFIYMEDDYFLGKPFKKSDFFYYDRKENKVLPYILTSEFSELDKNKSQRLYDFAEKMKDKFKFQGGQMWAFSLINTEVFFMKKYNKTIINTQFTHNARAENIDDLKEMFKSIQSYKYINQTLFSKERHVLSLNQPHYNNLFQLNNKHRKVNSIPCCYIEVQKVAEDKLDKPLFVINTGGDYMPTKEDYKNQIKVMQKRFPIPIKYEIDRR